MSTAILDESSEPIGPGPHVFSDDDDETGLTPAHPAATLVVFHEAVAGGPPQILMVRRSQAMRFAAGAAVFPGGRVDADDHQLGAQHASALAIDPRDAAGRIAAIRETIEETGLAVGLAVGAGDAALAAIRQGLLEEQPFSMLLERHGATLDLAHLVPFSRWRPNFVHSRVFDTRFYLARTTGPLPALSVITAENSALFWISAADALDRAASGELTLIFPTKRNLERLATFATYAQGVESAVQFAPRRITPFVTEENGQRYLCIRDDCGYPVIKEAVGTSTRS